MTITRCWSESGRCLHVRACEASDACIEQPGRATQLITERGNEALSQISPEERAKILAGMASQVLQTRIVELTGLLRECKPFVDAVDQGVQSNKLSSTARDLSGRIEDAIEEPS